MPFLALLGPWLLKNWKLVIVGLFAAWVGWLYWDNGHLKHKVEDLQLQIAKIVAENKALTDASAAISRKYDHTLADKWAVEQKLAKSEAERIKNDKILRSIKLPNVAVQLHNDAAAGGQQTTPQTQQGNDGGAPTTGGNLDPAADSGKTLADLEAAAIENIHRLNQAIATIHEWQAFWKDFNAAVTANENK